MWKIKHIFDGDYGCEEHSESENPKVTVTLVNEKNYLSRRQVAYG